VRAGRERRQDARRIEAFPEARPDDGRLELGVVTAGNPVQWSKKLRIKVRPGSVTVCVPSGRRE
jgi:hypothetical protein